MACMRILILGLICLAGTFTSSFAQTALDLSDPVIALKSQPEHGVLEGQAMPRGVKDNTVLAAPFVMEKCLEHIEGIKPLEQSFAGTRFVQVKNPLLEHIPGTSPIAYAHPDLYETFLYDQSSGTLAGCGLTMAGPNASVGFDRARTFFRDRYNMPATTDDALFSEAVSLSDIPVSGVSSNFGFATASTRVLMTPVNDNTGFVMSIFLQKAEG